MMTENIKIYSFDVFDTVLTRTVVDPKDIFILIQQRLSNIDLNLLDEVIRNFYSERIWAEFRARRSTKKEDIGIEDIYAQLKKRFGLNKYQIEELINIELELEYDAVCPIFWTINEINDLRRQGKRIVFISDMYLPEENIKNMLIEVGAYKEGDGLYLSGEIGATKYSGSIFDYVADKENCIYREISHCGDNLHSDVWIPAKKGITIYKTSRKDIEKVFRQNIFMRTREFVSIGMKLLSLRR